MGLTNCVAEAAYQVPRERMIGRSLYAVLVRGKDLRGAVQDLGHRSTGEGQEQCSTLLTPVSRNAVWIAVALFQGHAYGCSSGYGLPRAGASEYEQDRVCRIDD